MMLHHHPNVCAYSAQPLKPSCPVLLLRNRVPAWSGHNTRGVVLVGHAADQQQPLIAATPSTATTVARGPSDAGAHSSSTATPTATSSAYNNPSPISVSSSSRHRSSSRGAVSPSLADGLPLPLVLGLGAAVGAGVLALMYRQVLSKTAASAVQSMPQAVAQVWWAKGGRARMPSFVLFAIIN